MKIMPRLVSSSQVDIHISNVIVSDYDIVIFCKLMS